MVQTTDFTNFDHLIFYCASRHIHSRVLLPVSRDRYQRLRVLESSKTAVITKEAISAFMESRGLMGDNRPAAKSCGRATGRSGRPMTCRTLHQTRLLNSAKRLWCPV